MEYADVIVVGGGPAGSTCAWKLRAAGIDVLVLDKQAFPRDKLCAGWITPRCARDLALADYPYPMLRFRRFRITFRGVSFSLPTRQYSVRRVELDDWLLRRAGAPVRQHQVRAIARVDEGFDIDGRFRCRLLVGAGGTACPVYRALFARKRPRIAADLIAAMEAEFAHPVRDTDCRLWFGEYGLPGYAWYVPKGGDYVNVGIGGYSEKIRARGTTLARHWERFTDGLAERGVIDRRVFARTGYAYFLRRRDDGVADRNAYLIGDAAAVATRDLGEGIGPSVESALAVARAIVEGRPYSLTGITKYSIPGLLSAGLGVYPRHRVAS